MATWELEARSLLWPGVRRRAAATAAQAVMAAGVVALVAAGSYRALHTSLLGSQAQAAARTLEVAPALRPSPPGVRSQAGTRPAGAFAVRPADAARVVFGRFARRQDADARARLVRRKGYMATVVRVGEVYLVVSRAYSSPQAAQFWARVFREIGLRARVVPRLEALAVPGES
jgi:hypothetical protein